MTQTVQTQESPSPGERSFGTVGVWPLKICLGLRDCSPCLPGNRPKVYFPSTVMDLLSRFADLATLAENVGQFVVQLRRAPEDAGVGRANVPVIHAWHVNIRRLGFRDITASLLFDAAALPLDGWCEGRERDAAMGARHLGLRLEGAWKAVCREAMTCVADLGDEEKERAILFLLYRRRTSAPNSIAASTLRALLGVNGDEVSRWLGQAHEQGLVSYAPPSAGDAEERVVISERGAEHVRDQLLKENGPPPRRKAEKFKVLDSPDLLAEDLSRPRGILGGVVVYFDIDRFKTVNERFTERVVDRAVLDPLQRLVTAASEGNGFAYAEGGDEMIVYLPNSTERMGISFANALRQLIECHQFEVAGEHVGVTASFGVYSARCDDAQGVLVDRANEAKRHAKESGRNRVSVWRENGPQVVHDAPGE